MHSIALADALLFQAQVVLCKVDEKVMFFGGEMQEPPDGAGSAFDAVVGKGRECFSVHHQRGDVMRRDESERLTFLT